MQLLLPCLMFVDQCGKPEEAIELYVSAFEGSRVVHVEYFRAEDEAEGGQANGFEVAGREVMAMDSARPHQLSFTPAIALLVECDGEEDLDAAWVRFLDGATVLMALQTQRLQPRFGWLQDRFGVTWQLSLVAA
jgi:predicted 3-demethylubiquinone-9 3-methyltransferase (glyoxalase superfamily)